MAQTRTEAKIMEDFYDSIDKSLLATYKRKQPEETNQRDFKDIAERANVPLDYVIRRFDAISRKGDIDPLLKDTKRRSDRGGRAAMKDGELVGNQKKLDVDGSGSIDANDFKMLRNSKQEGGEMNQQMDMLMGMEQEQPMLPDEEMEEDYVDYVVEETLSNEDRNYLIDALEKDDRLSEIFDQVVESATEFTGSGTVEGPGTGRSDSIPARLSDGEFVITAKATEEIGADNLMSMMKDAEAAADERRMAYNGGPIREEKEVMATAQEPVQQNINVTKTTLDSASQMRLQDEDPVRKAVKENMMLDPYQKHVRS
jgi:hypothetical protein|tara:strand:- start:39 stop:977 length:939 start_codon:yes stop_codon:yes gene_type:complete